MSTLQFRVLVIAVLLFGLVGCTIDLVIPNSMTENISSYAETLNTEMEETSLFVLIIAVIPILICIIGSFIGLLLLKWWGRTLFLFGFLASLPLYFLTGTSVISPLAQIFYDIGAYGEGFILALCYFSPLSLHFKK